MAIYTGAAYDDLTLTSGQPGRYDEGAAVSLGAGDSYVGGAGAVSTDLTYGQAGPGYGGNGLSSLTIAGSTFTGGDDCACGAAGVAAAVDGTVSITGGTFNGGASGVGDGGTACAIAVGPTGSLSISGGTFNPGQNAALQPNGYGLGVALCAGLSGTISGGDLIGSSVNPRLALNLASGATLTLTGSSLAYSAGSISGTLSDGHNLSGLFLADITPGGTITASGGGATLTFSG